MRYLKLIFCLLFLYLNLNGFSQCGKDGNKTISSANTIVNEYTYLTANVTSGISTITVNNSSLNANGRFTSSLSAGDLVYIIQVQGATIQGGEWWIGAGYIDNYNNCGKNEFAQVLSVPNTTTINLTCPLTNNYTSSGKVQVIRVPRYESLTINNGGILTCDAWDGNKGGITVVETNDNTVINSGGKIDVTGKGFRGGACNNNSSSISVSKYTSSDMNDGAMKGEGIAGYMSEYNAFGGMYCQNAGGNSGGGGNSHNAGGGGGGNSIGDIVYAWNGYGNPDISNSSWIAAWNLESANFANNQSSGGGRGGYSFSENAVDPLTNAPAALAWGGDFRHNVGGQGGRPLNYNYGYFMGGGGGAGSQNNSYGGDGGNAGGMVYIYSFGSVSGGGSINANGNDGESSYKASPGLFELAGVDGSGGGGAGGTVIINSKITITGITITTNGGKGGSQIKTKGALCTANKESEGPGGGGGGGFITTSTCSGVTKQSLGGTNGICDGSQSSSTNYAMANFPPNGATKGGDGSSSVIINSFNIITINDTVCYGEDGLLSASIVGTLPTGTSIYWYSDLTGNNTIGSGLTLNINNAVASQTYYIGTCPGFYRVPVNLVVNPFSIDAGNDTSICLGNQINLHGSGGSSYSWYPSTGLIDPNIADPSALITASTKYYCNITNSFGCSGVDSVYISVNSVNADAGVDKIICEGQSVSFTATGGSSFSWNTGSINPTINVSPVTSQYYYVTATIGNCYDTASVFVKVNSVPQVNLGNDTSFCQGNSLLLNAGNNGMTYQWQDLSANQNFNVTSTGIYSCIVTDTTGCKGGDTISVTVNPNYNTTINTVNPMCANSNSINLHAVDTGGIWSGNGITNQSNGTFNPSVAGAGSHLIIYTISGNCGNKDTVQIKVFPVQNIYTQVMPESCTDKNDGAIILTVNGGTPPYSVSWNSGSNDYQLSNLSPGSYTVTVTDNNNCTAIKLEEIIAANDPCYTPFVYLPNIFSPNGDGQNDLFYVRGQGIKTFSLIIYDRWGEKVFETFELTNGWDGTYRGKSMPTETYTYIIKVEFIDGRAENKKGNISITR